ncbi:hypothetical protein G6F42_028407 [Rhizopus arrhizus]|nr:hypothetical protein G6F42_028407 [Rhizopus arrhizus]
MLLLDFTGIAVVLVVVDAVTAPADFGLSDMCFVSVLFPEPKRHVAPLLWPPNDRATWLASNPDSIKLFKTHKRALLLGRVNLSDDFSDAFSALMTIYKISGCYWICCTVKHSRFSKRNARNTSSS